MADSPEPIHHQALSQAWRLEHAQRGDLALIAAASMIEHSHLSWGAAQAWASIAQAHYAAANVRARAVADVGSVEVTGRVAQTPEGWPL